MFSADFPFNEISSFLLQYADAYWGARKKALPPELVEKLPIPEKARRLLSLLGTLIQELDRKVDRNLIFEPGKSLRLEWGMAHSEKPRLTVLQVVEISNRDSLRRLADLLKAEILNFELSLVELFEQRPRFSNEPDTLRGIQGAFKKLYFKGGFERFYEILARMQSEEEEVELRACLEDAKERFRGLLRSYSLQVLEAFLPESQPRRMALFPELAVEAKLNTLLREKLEEFLVFEKQVSEQLQFSSRHLLELAKYWKESTELLSPQAFSALIDGAEGYLDRVRPLSRHNAVIRYRELSHLEKLQESLRKKMMSLTEKHEILGQKGTQVRAAGFFDELSELARELGEKIGELDSFLREMHQNVCRRNFQD